MEEIKVKAKKWGNSLGFILPRKIVEMEGVKEGEDVVITVRQRKPLTVAKLLEIAKKHPLKKSKKSTQEIMDQIDFELYGIKK
jgi:antitoxin component of MazEF toxin-antitoxin module